MQLATLLCLGCLLLLPASALGGLRESQDSDWRAAPSLLFKGSRLRCFQSGHARLVEPYAALRVPRRELEVRKDPLGQGFYLSVPLVVKTDVRLPSGGARKWQLLKVIGFKVSLRKSITSGCAKSCPQVSVSGRWRAGHRPTVTFRCRRRAACLGLIRALRFRGSDHDELLSALRFTFHTWANRATFRLTRFGLPVENAVTRPFRNAFWFEGDKLILYTVKANSGHMAYETYQSEQTYAAPRDGSLPALYRSGLLDQLAQVASSGRWQIVVEMRTTGRVVTQAVFSANPNGLDKNSWFSADRLLSTQPYWFGRSDYNIFSIAGDVRSVLRRRFMINRHYGGCPIDTGLFTVFDMRDACPYGSRAWRGKAPVLLYNPQNGAPNAKSAAYADQFLIYLRMERPVPPPFAAQRSGLKGGYKFENGKVLLFTVKANSGHKAVATFLHMQPKFNKASKGPLPTVFRSDLIDNLSQAVISSGKQYLVAEMRVGNRAVAQVVFDTSINRQKLDKQNWFHQSRVVSSFPYRAVRALTQKDGFFHNPKVRDPRFQHFSVVGDARWKRGFFINFGYKGCPADRGFWTVSDARDPCLWGNKGWHGSPPALVYTKGRAGPMQAEAKFADRFLIYLK